MKLRKSIVLSLVLILAVAQFSSGQNLSNAITRECGTVVSPEQKRAELERAARGYSLLVPQLNRPYQIPLTIHIVRATNGTGGFTLENLNVAMQDLNQLWLPVGIQFYQRGNVDFINNSTFLNIPDNRADRDNLRRVNPVNNTINVYFTNLAELCGEATFTTDALQGILMSNNCAGIGNNPSTFAHEVGHYFDLYHTHETVFGVECPNGSNCTPAGDLLCDTPADPELNYETNVDTACVWTGTATPPMSCGSTPAYAPSTRNVMSYSRRTCRNLFTANQNSRTLNILRDTANRSNLINTATRYVAPDGDLNSNCTYQTPCRTLARAVQVANADDTIFLLSGSYPGATPLLNKSVVLKKWNTDAGIITIGQITKGNQTSEKSFSPQSLWKGFLFPSQTAADNLLF